MEKDEEQHQQKKKKTTSVSHFSVNVLVQCSHGIASHDEVVLDEAVITSLDNFSQVVGQSVAVLRHKSFRRVHHLQQKEFSFR